MLVALAAASAWAASAFSQHDEAAFKAAFQMLTADSYEAPLPAFVQDQCVNRGPAALAEMTVTGDALASELADVCGPTTLCVLEDRVVLDADWNVGALVVRGELVMRDDTFLCAGYVAVEGAGALRAEGGGGVYVKNNGAAHPVLRTRAVGSVAARGSTVKPTIDISGRPLGRTWSLLAAPAPAGATTLELVHDVAAAGWRIGDRVAIAPTEAASRGSSESFDVVALDRNVVTLSAPLTAARRAEFEALEDHALTLSAEVVNLSRDFLVTGDDFEEVPCDPSLGPGQQLPVSDGGESHWAGCMCTSTKTSCTVGLHTKAIGGGVHKIRHARVEKCGQRGVFGKYCAHFHEMGVCGENCVFEGNAVEFGMQRGIVVHNTHLARVSNNVFHDVRGPVLYVQDGLEMWNRFEYNVAVCAKSLSNHGCSIPGTDNAQADTSVNNAAYFAVSATQDLVGNRMANWFNAMMVEVDTPFGDGMGRANGKVCAGGLSLGRIEGNFFHGSGRFGTYFIGSNFPVHTDRSLATGGVTSPESCEAFDAAGNDRGKPGKLAYNTDWGNAFVGSYFSGDMQRAPARERAATHVQKRSGTRPTRRSNPTTASIGRRPSGSPTAARRTSRTRSSPTRPSSPRTARRSSSRTSSCGARPTSRRTTTAASARRASSARRHTCSTASRAPSGEWRTWSAASWCSRRARLRTTTSRRATSRTPRPTTSWPRPRASPPSPSARPTASAPAASSARARFACSRFIRWTSRGRSV